MPSERWRQIDELYHAARERGREVLADADPEVKRQVESLLAQDTAGDGLLDRPAAELLGDSGVVSLAAGTRLGPYRIEAPIGKGGMGEVFRATDTRLGRAVAIKISAQRFTDRFEREARAISSLNHSNICTLYDVGPNYLVMELIEGPTLAERIGFSNRAQGPIPLEEALRIAGQIADALEAAHEKGIVHRDLKPANIKVRPDGSVKVLDFGLAKEAESTSDSPTMLSVSGMIVGTAGYMSPEQARGQRVDKRTDIWAFGVVLYEMVTGRKLFERATVSDTLAAVIKEEPDWGRVPAKVQRLLRRCLEKDRSRRLRDISGVELLLEDAPAAPLKNQRRTGENTRVGHRSSSAWMGRRPMGTPSQSRFGKAGKAGWIVAGMLALIAAGVSVVHFRAKPPIAETMRFRIEAPEKTSLVGPPAVSPNGRFVAFTARAGKQTSIWVRSLEDPEARRLPDTEGVSSSLFWSPDSRFVGFAVDRKLKKIEASGGPAQTVCDLPADLRGAAWAPDGVIVLSTNFQPLMRVPDTGGALVPLTSYSPGAGDATDLNPWFLPDGRHFLYARGASGAIEGGVYAGSLDDKPEKQSSRLLLSAEYPNAPVYVPSGSDSGSGYLLFAREGSLVAGPFNARRLQATGAAVRVADGIVPGYYSASNKGILALTDQVGGSDNRLLWFDRQGKQVGQIGPAAPWSNVQLAPDGKLLVADRVTNNGYEHLWSADLARGVFSRLNPGDISDYSPVISPDGRVAFTWTPGGVAGDIYVKLASGAGAAEPLVKSASMKHPNHWSLDGRYLLYDEHTAQQQDLWVVPMLGDRKPIPFLVTPADETDANFSPDTKWIAYSSDESGRREVYVQGFVPGHIPAAGVGKWQISNAGGDKVRWRRDGKELYYINGDGELMAVPIKSTATTFEAGVPVPLFETHPKGFFPYDVAPDGRFLIDTAGEGGTAGSSITVVVNWTAGLNK